MREYELVYILDPDLAEESIQALIERFHNLATSQGAEIKKQERWEKRRMAYEIKRKREGIYVVVRFDGPSTAADELHRVLGITEGVIRHLIVRAEEMKGEQGRTVSNMTAPAVTEAPPAPPVEAAPAPAATDEATDEDAQAPASDETATGETPTDETVSNDVVATPDATETVETTATPEATETPENSETAETAEAVEEAPAAEGEETEPAPV